MTHAAAWHQAVFGLPMVQPAAVLLLGLITFAALGQKVAADTSPDVLYSLHSSGGGPELTTESRHWGYCKVWVKTTITKSYAAGHARNNPDGSFYPGDGFGYSFEYGWSGDPLKCRNLTVCPVESNHIRPMNQQECSIQNLKILDAKASTIGRSAIISGAAEISAAEASGHYIKLQVNAERWGCHYPKKLPRVCGWAQISAAGTFAPNVPRPNTAVMLSHEYVYDSDGYKSGNLDGTHYLWDAIAIVHNPVYAWKADRVGTLSIVVTKLHDLIMEKEFQCGMPTCQFTLEHSGFEPWFRQYEYGEGLTIYNATRQDDIKKQVFAYKIDLYNLGNLIHRSENKTALLVVGYEPVYRSYPYLVLSDGHWWSWSHRQAVAIEYKGSVGGGPDDAAGIHGDRRSKINHYDHDGYAFDPILQVNLNETLSWNQAGRIPTHLDQVCLGGTMDYSAFEAKKGPTAMFVKAGFGKILFSYPILKAMLENRYVNATVQNTLYSVDFAGYEKKEITGYQYQYPDVKFSNPVKILTYDSDGSRTDLPVAVVMVPDLQRGAQYIQNYTCNKVLRDTASAGIADIVVSDMFGKENAGSGTGYLNMKTHMTSVWFPPFYSLLASDVLDMPIHQGYKALSPYEITVTVGEKKRTLHRIVNFLSPFVHVVNLDEDNPLKVNETSGFVTIRADEKFGDIALVRINGRTLKEDCTNGCTTVAYAGGDMSIEAWNEWGGKATAHIQKSREAPTLGTNWDAALVAVAAMLAGILLWRLIGASLRRLVPR